MAVLKCEDCSYYWANPNEKHATCKFEQVTLFDIPPCEEDLWNDETDGLQEPEQYMKISENLIDTHVLITHILDDDDENEEE